MPFQPNTMDNAQYDMYKHMMGTPTFGPGAAIVQHQEPTLQEKANYVKQISDNSYANSNPFGHNPFGPSPNTSTGPASLNIGNPFQNTPNQPVAFGNISNPFGGPTAPNAMFSSNPTPNVFASGSGFNSGGFTAAPTIGFTGNNNVFGSNQGFNPNSAPSNNMFGGAGFGGFGVGAGGSGGGMSGPVVSYGGNPNTNTNPFTSNTQPSSNPFL